MVLGRAISIITIAGIPGVGIPIGKGGVPVCVASVRVWIASVGAISVGTVVIRPILHVSRLRGRCRFNCDRTGRHRRGGRFAHCSRCEQTGNCDRDRELRSCDLYEFLLLELDQSYVVFGTPVIVTNLAIAGSTANVSVRLASFYWA